MPYTVTTRNSYGWLRPPNTDNGLKPRLGLLTSEFARVVNMDAIRIRDRVREGRIPGVRLQDIGLVIAYAMTVSDIIDHFDLAPDQERLLRLHLLTRVTGEYKHRLTYSNDVMRDVPLRTEFSTLDEFKAENLQSFISNVDESAWID